jgi:cytochrome c oxidase subunit 2
MLYFVVRYRRGNQATQYQVSAAHNTPLELAWSIIPLIVMVPIFYFGFKGYFAKIAAPSDAEEIFVRGQKWNWSFTYRNGASPKYNDEFKEQEITKTGKTVPHWIAPVGRPVRMLVSSSDVIHAFYIPDFRVKIDAIPNRYTTLWFKPESVGDHVCYCAEYCGQDHSEMGAVLTVLPRDEYEAKIRKWTDYDDADTLLKVGQAVYTGKGCNACHTINGQPGTGPTWKNMFGETHQYTDGTSHAVDEDWLRENILYSQKRIVAGYPTSMPVYAGQLSNLEVDGVVWYIKSLKDGMSADALRGRDQTVKQYREAQKAAPKQ